MSFPKRSRSNKNMAETGTNRRKSASYAAAILAAAGLVLSPLMVPAVAAPAVNSAASLPSSGWFGSFTPAGVDSRLAAKYAEHARLGSTKFPFTPAGIVPGRNRTMTVAARTDAPLGAVSVRTAINAMEQGNGNNTLRLASTSYRLTASRGWQGFVLPGAQQLAPQKPLIEFGRTDFRLDDGAKGSKSKFSTDISVGKVETVAPPARGPSASGGDYNLKLGGAFSISKKVDLTAGVRYANEHDRLEPVAGNRNDAEAVYVGTKIRF